LRCDLGVARPEVQGDPGPEARTWGHGLHHRSGEAEEGGEDRGRGGAQRRWVTTWSGLSGRRERATRLARGVGARAGARQGREGGYGEEARHIIRALGGDVHKQCGLCGERAQEGEAKKVGGEDAGAQRGRRGTRAWGRNGSSSRRPSLEERRNLWSNERDIHSPRDPADERLESPLICPAHLFIWTKGKDILSNTMFSIELLSVGPKSRDRVVRWGALVRYDRSERGTNFKYRGEAA
jgi:hypothetical protein